MENLLTPDKIEQIKSSLPTAEEAEHIYANEKPDPFPNIPPALLNSADIIDYVIKTGMLLPFQPENVKSSSYEIKLLGKCVLWEENGTKQVFDITEGKSFELKKNSIAFVTLEPFFRIPDYIALRFNLKIANVYRGLLLGTGPLVDPGFKGRLSIPLHNLTTNNYTFRGGEGIIWMEFTKVSPNKRWFNMDEPDRVGEYVKFRRKEMDVEDYLYKADPHRPIRSSIPDEINKAIDIANSAKSRVNIITLGGLVAAAGINYGMFWPTHQIVEDTTVYVKASQLELNQLRDYRDRITKLEEEINKLKSNRQIKIIKKETRFVIVSLIMHFISNPLKLL
ncbi:MAG: hypothetical protein WCK54_19325 [Desulfuromonadales bacterium]